MMVRPSSAGSPSPLGAAGASAIFPGWGQLRAGHRRLGLAVVTGFSLFLAASAVAVIDEGALGVIGWMVDPQVLLALLVVDLLTAAVRVLATAHAWIASGGRLARPGLLILVLLVAVPHAAAGYFIFETRSTLLSVFAAPPSPIPIAAAGSSTTLTIPTTSTEPALTSPSFLPYIPAAPSTEPSTTTTIPTTTTTLPMGTERLTVLLLGGDDGPGRGGLRTDTVIVVSVDTSSGDSAVFGLPRNLGGLSFSDGTEFPGMGRGMLNEVYQWSTRNPGRFAGVDPGATAVADVASTLLGIPIDHFILVDMSGFAVLVDLLGGVTVDVGRETRAPLYDPADGTHTMISIAPGTQHLSGDIALALARSRTGSNDYDRMSRQRCLLSAIADQIEPLSLLARLPPFLHAVEENVTTDIPLSKIPYIVNLASRVSADRTIVVGLDRGFRDGETANGLLRPDVGAIHAAVQSALVGGGDNDSLRTASEVCTS